MKINAESLAKKPAAAYRAADKGEAVIINHDRYPDKVFELTARERKPYRLIDKETGIEIKEKYSHE